MKTIAPRMAALAIAALTATTLVACGTSGSSSGPSSTSSPTATGTAAAEASATSAASSGDIVIGLANTEGPQISVPEYRYGAEAAVDYLNATGGINGHQIKLDECITDGSPSGSANCANKFVSDHAVAYFAGFDTGADGALPIVSAAGVPYISWVTQGDTLQSSPDAFFLGDGLTESALSPLPALKAAGVTKVAFFWYDQPQNQAFTAVIKSLAAKAGITVTPVAVSPTNPDWTSAVATAQADGAAALWGVLQESDCTSMVRTARAAGFNGPIEVGSCTAYLSALGNGAANTLGAFPYYYPQLRSSAPPAVQQQIDIYTKYMTAVGHASYVSSNATATFGAMVELAEAMKTIKGTVTAASLKATLATAKMPGFLGDTVNCAVRPYPTEKSVCDAGTLLYKVVSSANGPVRELQVPGFVNVAQS